MRRDWKSEAADQTMMPGTTLVAIRMTEQTVARAVARMFMGNVLSDGDGMERLFDQTIVPGTTLTATKKLEQTMARAAAKSWL